MPTDTNQPNQAQIQPVVLIICDGWGVAPPSDGNAITQAKLPVFNRLLKTYPAMTIIASGNEVGLEWGQMGNSEVGHLNIGAGRVYYQTLLRINQSISSGAFFKDETLLKATAHVKKNKSRLHLMGMVSNGNVHSAEEHLYALLKFAAEQKIKEVYIHMFLDGRDALFNGGGASLERLQAKIKEYGVGRVASLAGRFYALDRDNRWDRIEKTYRAIAEGTGEQSSDPAEAIKASYAKEVYDEQFVPVTITDGGKPVATVEDNDAVIFFNFRPDRARELTKAFALPGFDKFTARAYKNLLFVTMAEFEKSLPVEVVFPPDVIKNCLAEVVSN
ncbi:MAG TPA: phosphoglycerate mutase (2,3-diphosphoglycerate-independent), partial [Candidatus Magasanikbacteria bacterium]|nr:phosphoglycerate mutase (2,3-diphosphoglycerate-independent) [Candidatus Magasanikbacteria bacterium]